MASLMTRLAIAADTLSADRTGPFAVVSAVAHGLAFAAIWSSTLVDSAHS